MGCIYRTEPVPRQTLTLSWTAECRTPWP